MSNEPILCRSKKEPANRSFLLSSLYRTLPHVSFKLKQSAGPLPLKFSLDPHKKHVIVLSPLRSSKTTSQIKSDVNVVMTIIGNYHDAFHSVLEKSRSNTILDGDHNWTRWSRSVDPMLSRGSNRNYVPTTTLCYNRCTCWRGYSNLLKPSLN